MLPGAWYCFHENTEVRKRRLRSRPPAVDQTEDTAGESTSPKANADSPDYSDDDGEAAAASDDVGVHQAHTCVPTDTDVVAGGGGEAEFTVTSPWFLRFGKHFKGQRFNFGSGVWFKPAPTKYKLNKHASRLQYGVFLGYRLAPGGDGTASTWWRTLTTLSESR